MQKILTFVFFPLPLANSRLRVWVALKTIKLKRKIVQNRLQKFYVLCGTPPAKMSGSAPGYRNIKPQSQFSAFEKFTKVICRQVMKIFASN